MTEQMKIRVAVPDDHAAISRLAALDSARSLETPMLLAEEDGALVAAVSLRDGRVIADPFRPTADVVAKLRSYSSPQQSSARPRRPALVAVRAAFADGRR